MIVSDAEHNGDKVENAVMKLQEGTRLFCAWEQLSAGPALTQFEHHPSTMLGRVSPCAKRANRQLFAPILLRKNHGQATPSSSQSSGRTASFGFRTVPEESKETLVKGVFDSVASNYDLMNDASSLGVHRLWKDTFVSALRPGRKGPIRCIDVAGGTGDIALRILDHAREEYADRETTVEIVDINAQMLREGFRRFKKTMYHNSESVAGVPET
jgi:2-methoxy-6-polyprenyl-1,4-benzoquinol methylase